MILPLEALYRQFIKIDSDIKITGVNIAGCQYSDN